MLICPVNQKINTRPKKISNLTKYRNRDIEIAKLIIGISRLMNAQIFCHLSLRHVSIFAYVAYPFVHRTHLKPIMR